MRRPKLEQLLAFNPSNEVPALAKKAFPGITDKDLEVLLANISSTGGPSENAAAALTTLRAPATGPTNVRANMPRLLKRAREHGTNQTATSEVGDRGDLRQGLPRVDCRDEGPDTAGEVEGLAVFMKIFRQEQKEVKKIAAALLQLAELRRKSSEPLDLLAESLTYHADAASTGNDDFIKATEEAEAF